MRAELDNGGLASQIESVLLAAGGSVSIGALAAATGRPVHQVRACVDFLARAGRGGVRVLVHGDEAQLATAPENAFVVQRYLGVARPPALSRSALEVLAVIGYRQPVTRPEVEAIRGVNSDRAISTLLARGIIEEKGKRTGPGRPAEYVTTFGFLEYFGLNSLGDLPPLPNTGEEVEGARGLGLREVDIQRGGPSDDEPPPGLS